MYDILSQMHLAACYQSFLHSESASSQHGMHPFISIDNLKNCIFSDLKFSHRTCLDAGRSLSQFIHIDEQYISNILEFIRPELPLASFLDILTYHHHEPIFIFHTSGSTGESKTVYQHLDFLMQEANCVLNRQPIVQRVVCAVPLHHTFGFTMGMMTSRRCSCPCEQIVPFPGAICRAIAPNTVILGIPFLWELVFPLLQDVPSSTLLLSAGAPLSAATATKYAEKGINLLNIYGSSETGALGLCKAGERYFTLPPHFEHEGERLFRRLPDGTRAQIQAEDVLAWQDNRHFSLVGRIDKAVQVAGVNVYPHNIAEKISQHPYVRECAVRLDLTHRVGRLKTFVVPAIEESDAVIKKALVRFCIQTLTPPERPVRIRLGKELPRNPMGKLADWD